jgi:hypothetical protein
MVAYRLNHLNEPNSANLTSLKLETATKLYSFYSQNLSILIIDQIYNALSQLIKQEDVQKDLYSLASIQT